MKNLSFCAVGGKFPASQLSEQELAVYRHREKQKMYKNLSLYLDICARAKVIIVPVTEFHFDLQ